MYYVYIDKMLCPIAPEKLQVKIKNKNKQVTLINEGEINILKTAGLTDVQFDLLIPNVKYPFATYTSGFQNAKYFLDKLESLKVNNEPFQFIVVRTLPNGKMLYNTNMKVSLEEYSPSDNAKEGFDVVVSVKLKQYRDYGTKTCNIQFASTKPKIATPKPARETTKSPAPTTQNKTYTVQSGDCLWAIAKKFYGNGSQWEKIYSANSGVCGKPYKKGGTTYVMIHPGDVLTIPA